MKYLAVCGLMMGCGLVVGCVKDTEAGKKTEAAKKSKTVQTAKVAAGSQCGTASWYSLPGNLTANGERMNPNAMTAAHKSLPFGTKLRVVNPKNGRAIVVRINDRGPFIKGRVLDLSKGAASKLNFIRSGHTRLCWTKVG